MSRACRILVSDEITPTYGVRQVVEPRQFNSVSPWKDLAASKTGFELLSEGDSFIVKTVMHEVSGIFIMRSPEVGDVLPQLAFLWSENYDPDAPGTPYEIAGVMYTLAERVEFESEFPDSGFVYAFRAKEARSLDKMPGIV